MLILLSALGVFFFVAQQTFSEDKKLFVMDLNRTLLKATTSEIKLQLKGRLEELQVFVPRVYRPLPQGFDPFQGLPDALKSDLLSVWFYQPVKGAKGQYKNVAKYVNPAAAKENSLETNFSDQMNQARPLPFAEFEKDPSTLILNRSIRYQDKDITVISFMLNANFLNDESSGVVIVVDLLQRFLIQQLQQSEMAEVFLIFNDGRLLSHPSLADTVSYAAAPFPHPIVEKLSDSHFTRESMEVEVNGEPYLCNIAETGFRGIYAVSQTLKSEAFLALQTLLHKSALLAILIFSASVAVSVFFASGLTSNIQKLRVAAEAIGKGDLDVKINIQSNDEIRSVARSFQWMTNQLRTLIQESLEKARLADELETARLVQSTLLASPVVNTDAVEILSHYVAATECGGDYWDAYYDGRRLTIFIGDATGHGAPAAIVTAVAKSCFTTLNSFFQGQMAPEKLLATMNDIIYAACRGKLLMTMVVIQLDLVTGDIAVSNAGHESPMCLRTGPKDGKRTVDVFFARGERLGFDPGSTYDVERGQMTPGDTLLLYTDGISEARDAGGKEFGERALKKALSAKGMITLGEVKESIVQKVAEHIGEAKQEDDITFVIFRLKRHLAASEVKEPTASNLQGLLAIAPHRMATTVSEARVAPPSLPPKLSSTAEPVPEASVEPVVVPEPEAVPLSEPGTATVLASSPAEEMPPTPDAVSTPTLAEPPVPQATAPSTVPPENENSGLAVLGAETVTPLPSPAPTIAPVSLPKANPLPPPVALAPMDALDVLTAVEAPASAPKPVEATEDNPAPVPQAANAKRDAAPSNASPKLLNRLKKVSPAELREAVLENEKFSSSLTPFADTPLGTKQEKHPSMSEPASAADSSENDSAPPPSPDDKDAA